MVMPVAKAAPLIEVKALGLQVQGKALLSDISFRADQARIGVVGRNGSGKTTLARVLAGLTLPTAGKVLIGGIDVARDRKAAIRTVGILFQNPDHQIIFPTVEEEIAFGPGQLGLPRKDALAAAHAILARFGKSHWAKAAVHRLSQGQKQLLCLMAVLVMRPRTLILDEPFAGLDLPTQAQLARYIDALQVQVVHISHDPAALEGYDRVLWLDQGRIVQDGTAAPTLGAFAARMAEIGGNDDISDLAD